MRQRAGVHPHRGDKDLAVTGLRFALNDEYVRRVLKAEAIFFIAVFRPIARW